MINFVIGSAIFHIGMRLCSELVKRDAIVTAPSELCVYSRATVLSGENSTFQLHIFASCGRSTHIELWDCSKG